MPFNRFCVKILSDLVFQALFFKNFFSQERKDFGKTRLELLLKAASPVTFLCPARRFAKENHKNLWKNVL